MWTDNETDRDFLNFSGVADTVAEIIRQAQGRPVSIGVSGAWGVGKSSMVKLIRKALGETNEAGRQFLFVDFNAWLYQGYDDARAALMDVIAQTLEAAAEENETALEKVREFAGRVRWARVLKLAASAAPMTFGLPPTGVLGQVVDLAKHAIGKGVDQEAVRKAEQSAAGLASVASELLAEKPDSTPPKEIHALRDSFKAALEELDTTLVVLIDDLDRCLPETAISTLEAIRLFLFLDHTAFVIAADDAMIKHAVRRHFGSEVDNEIATNYFDKLINVPIRVPPLGTQEVRAYMLLLFIDISELGEQAKEEIRQKICDQLAHSWEGKRADLSFVKGLGHEFPPSLTAQLDVADRLAPIMTSASKIRGNPRLIKRFLNALAICRQIARHQGISINEPALVKLMLLDRCGDPMAYAALAKAVNEDAEGRPRFLAEWEARAAQGEHIERDAPWKDAFVLEWLRLTPPLAELDLRGELYVSRENLPLLRPQDRLTSKGAEMLEALLTQPGMADGIAEEVRALSPEDLEIVMARLLDRAGQEREWGTPEILDACIVVADTSPVQASRLAAFLDQRPTAQIKPDIVPKLVDKEWAQDVLRAWYTKDVSPPVKRAITSQRRKHGNLPV